MVTASIDHADLAETASHSVDTQRVTFAEHLAVASTRLGVSAFALAVLLAGAEPEELATAVTASLRDAPPSPSAT